MFHERLPSDVVIAIEDTASAILEEALDALTSERITDFEDCRLMIEESRAGEGGACHLETDHQLDLLECHGEDVGLDILHHTSIRDLRVQIEEASAAVLSALAREQAAAALDALERLVQNEDLEATALVTSNPYAWARHYAESDEGPCHVYHYRNVEGAHVDVLELELAPDRTVFLLRPVDPHDLTPQELTFEAA